MKHPINMRLTVLLLCPILLASSCHLSQSAAPATASDVPPPPSYEIIGGYAIKSDYTGLTSYQPADEKYTRLSDAPLTELTPSPDYKTLLPYVGKTLYDDSGNMLSSVYGLMTKAGEIVTDAIYSGVWQGNYYDYGNNTGIIVPAYHLQKQSETINKKDPWKSVMHAACGIDGSWVTPFDYQYVYFLDTVIILVRDNETNDADVMDYNGHLLYNTKELSCYNSLPPGSAYLFQSGYGEGLFALTLKGGMVAYVEAETGDEKDLAFSECCAFSDGFAAVKKDGLFGYIDRSYQLVIPPQYMSAEFFDAGKSIVQYPTGLFALIDSTGNALLTSNNYISRWNAHIYGLTDNNHKTRYFDSNLNEIRRGDSQLDPQYDGWLSYKTADGVAISNVENSKTTQFKGVDGVGYIKDGLVSVYKSRNTWQEGLMTVDGQALIAPADNQSITISTSEISKKTYVIASLYTRSKQNYKVFDAAGHLLFQGSGWANFLPVQDLFEIRDDFGYGYTDTSGAYIFRISLMNDTPD